MKMSWAMRRPASRTNGTGPRFWSSRVICPSKPGSHQPASEWLIQSRPSVDLSFRSQATLRGMRTYSSVEASTTSPGKSLTCGERNSSGSRVGQIQWSETRTS